MWLAATPVSLRASTPYKKNRNFVAPASPQVRPLITMRQPVLLAATPASSVRNHTLRKLGDQLPWGCAAGGEQGDKGGRSASAGLAGLGRRAHTDGHWIDKWLRSHLSRGEINM